MPDLDDLTVVKVIAEFMDVPLGGHIYQRPDGRCFVRSGLTHLGIDLPDWLRSFDALRPVWQRLVGEQGIGYAPELREGRIHWPRATRVIRCLSELTDVDVSAEDMFLIEPRVHAYAIAVALMARGERQ